MSSRAYQKNRIKSRGACGGYGVVGLGIGAVL